MTVPSRVIYLPPGVTPTPAPAGPITGLPSAVPFDRAFFEQVLPQSIRHFCEQVDCGQLPVVELLTVDGTTHYVNGISGVSDSWVALHTSNIEHEHPVQVFIPYQTIFRLSIHPAEDHGRRRLGFLVERDGEPAAVLRAKPAGASAAIDAPAASKARPAATRKRAK